jgi:enamine deaminase RidA (YjgF/YER057c/UK114 family)
MTIYEKLESLHIALPQATPPVGAFVPYVACGHTLFLSGHIAKQHGQSWRGQLGHDLSTDAGREAARAVAIDLLGTLHSALGDLRRVRKIVKLMVLVNSSPSFTEHHLVANGASELLVEVFGEAGRHVRAAYGVAQIPLGACVEIDLIAHVHVDGDGAAGERQ